MTGKKQTISETLLRISMSKSEIDMNGLINGQMTSMIIVLF